jgi:hypothetical protein
MLVSPEISHYSAAIGMVPAATCLHHLMFVVMITPYIISPASLTVSGE